MCAYVLTYYDIFWLLSALACKRRCFILPYNIQPKFGRTFFSQLMGLLKPSEMGRMSGYDISSVK